MSEFQKIKVSTNQGDLERALARSEGRIEFYQTAINSIKDIKPDIVFASNDLKLLFDNPKAYLVDRIIAEPTTIGGLELNKDKVFELLEDHENLNKIVDYINSLKKHDVSNQSKSNIHAYTVDYLIISETSEVFLKAEAIKKIEDSNSIFLTSQKQKDYHDSLKIIEGELKKIKVYRISESKFLHDNFKFNYHGDLLGINYDNILRER